MLIKNLREKNFLDKTEVGKQRIRNRRHSYLTKVLRKQDYFSVDNMMQRDPYLYKKMFGTLTTEAFTRDMKLSDRLLKNYDYDEMERRCKEQQQKESDIEEEEEEDDEEDIDLMKKEDTTDEISNDESNDYKLQVYMRLMEQRFLNGEDVGFVDYNKIDKDESLDDLEQMGRDAEDDYFDGEEPCDAMD
jgi:hypothetical protein